MSLYVWSLQYLNYDQTPCWKMNKSGCRMLAGIFSSICVIFLLCFGLLGCWNCVSRCLDHEAAFFPSHYPKSSQFWVELLISLSLLLRMITSRLTENAASFVAAVSSVGLHKVFKSLHGFLLWLLFVWVMVVLQLFLNQKLWCLVEDTWFILGCRSFIA